MYNLLHQNYGNDIKKNSQIKGSKRIHFKFVSLNLLKLNKQYRLTIFNKRKTSDHRGIFFDINRRGILKNKIKNILSPFEQSINSKHAPFIRK